MTTSQEIRNHYLIKIRAVPRTVTIFSPDFTGLFLAVSEEEEIESLWHLRRVNTDGECSKAALLLQSPMSNPLCYCQGVLRNKIKNWENYG